LFIIRVKSIYLKEKSGVLVAGGGGGSSFGLAGWFGFILSVNKLKVCETETAQPNGIAWKYIKRAFFSVVCTVVVVALSPLSTLARILYKSFLAGLDLDLDPSTTKYTKKQFQFFTKFVFTIKI
jgi:hypothetical protein